MKTSRTIGQRRGVAAAGNNQIQPQAQAEGVAMRVYPARLTDVEVWASLAQVAQDITMKAPSMTAKVNRQNVQRENAPVCSMADKLRDFTRTNPSIFTR